MQNKMETYDKRMKREQIEKLPVGTITITGNGNVWENAYIEIPKNSHWLHFYTSTGFAYTIPALRVEDIEWKEKWK